MGRQGATMPADNASWTPHGFFSAFWLGGRSTDNEAQSFSRGTCFILPNLHPAWVHDETGAFDGDTVVMRASTVERRLQNNVLEAFLTRMRARCRHVVATSKNNSSWNARALDQRSEQVWVLKLLCIRVYGVLSRRLPTKCCTGGFSARGSWGIEPVACGP